MQLPKDLSCIEKLILTYINANGDDEYSVSALSQTLAVSRKSTHNALRRLVRQGFLDITEEASGRRANAYRVAPAIKKNLCNK